MAGQNPSPWPIVCAIDFGTTYSGYAYSVRADYEVNPLKVETIPWKNNLQTSKTSTCILFDNFGNFHSFGYDAEKQYTTLAERAQQNMKNDENDDNNDEKESAIKHIVEEEDTFGDWLYFKWFKMKLFQNSSVRSIMTFVRLLINCFNAHEKLIFGQPIQQQGFRNTSMLLCQSSTLKSFEHLFVMHIITSFIAMLAL